MSEARSRTRLCVDCGAVLEIAHPRSRLLRCGSCKKKLNCAREGRRRRAARSVEQQAHLDEYRSLKAQGLKRCTRCEEVLPLEEFHQSGTSRLRGECRTCKSQIDAFRSRDPDKQRDQSLRRQYGITLEEYLRMSEEQGHVCAVCGRPPEGSGLVVDHDHVTGKVRGLLCRACNTALGLLEEDQARMRGMDKYVERHKWHKSVFIASKAM